MEPILEELSCEVQLMFLIKCWCKFRGILYHSWF